VEACHPDQNHRERWRALTGTDAQSEQVFSNADATIADVSPDAMIMADRAFHPGFFLGML
jgi:hypothetical protein